MNGVVTPEIPLVWTPFGWVPLTAPVFLPGAYIRIGVPVTSRCTGSVRAFVIVRVYEGSVLPGHGTELGKYNSSESTIVPSGTETFYVYHTTEKGSIDRRDIGVEVWYWDGSDWVQDGSEEWDDVYYVREEFHFDIGQPVVSAA